MGQWRSDTITTRSTNMLYTVCCILEYMASIHHGNLIGDVPAFLSPLINGAPKLSAMISTHYSQQGKGFKRRGYMRMTLHNHPQA